MARIAFVTGTFPEHWDCPGAIYSQALASALTQQGHELHIITSAREDILPIYKKTHVHKIMSSWRPFEIYKIISLFKSINPEIMHILFPTQFSTGPTKLLLPLLPETNRLLWKIPCVT